MHHSRRIVLGLLATAGASSLLPRPGRAAPAPALPAAVARAIAVYGEVLACTRSDAGREVVVRIRVRQRLAAGLQQLCRLGPVRAGGNEVCLASGGGTITIRHEGGARGRGNAAT